MAQLLVELCTILIEEHLGERTASLWQHLADVGRTSFKGLLASSGVPEEELAKVLSILILHSCINYYTDEEYSVAYYTVDIDSTYNLLRLSRLVVVVRKRCGPDAAGVFANIAQFGHVTVADLTRSYRLGTDIVETASTRSNGHGSAVYDQSSSKAQPSTSIKTIEQLHSAILVLLRAGFLIKAQPRFTQNPYDLEQKLEKQVIEEEFAGQRVTGPVSSRKFRDAVSSRKRKQQEDDLANDELGSYNADTSLPPYKRRKLTGRMTNGHSGTDHNAKLPDDLILYINSKKYVIALRSEHLEVTATHALGSTAGSIYGALLRTLEKQIHDVKRESTTTVLNYDSDDEEEGVVATSVASAMLPKTTVMEVIAALPSEIDYTASMNVHEKNIPEQTANGHKTRKTTIVDEDDFSGIGIKAEPLSDDDDDIGHADDYLNLSNRAKTFELMNDHLELLAEHASSFCSKATNKNPPEWQVDFAQLTERLLLAEIDMTISARFGTTTTRLVRLLRDKGKLEEKQISQQSFLPLRTVRALLTEVFANGFVDAQELAKDNSRQPSKALYLWYFDFKKVRSSMLQQCYQAICRVYQRMAFERRRFATIIEKAENIIRDRLIERRTVSLQGAVDRDAYLDTYTHGINDAEDDIDQGDALIEDSNDASKEANGVSDSTLPSQEQTNDNNTLNGDHAEDEPSSETIIGDNNTNQATPLKHENHSENDLRDPDRGKNVTNDERLRACSKYVMSVENLSKDMQMGTYEKTKYREWKSLETLFLGHIMKLDDLVLLLRDF